MPPPLPELGSQALVLLSIGFFGLVPDYAHLFRKSCCRACLCVYTQAAFGKAGAVQSIAAAGGNVVRPHVGNVGSFWLRKRREKLHHAQPGRAAKPPAWGFGMAKESGGLSIAAQGTWTHHQD